MTDELLFNEDEADCIRANLETPRRVWLSAYYDAVSNGLHDAADYYLDYVQDFDRMIAKVEMMTSD